MKQQITKFSQNLQKEFQKIIFSINSFSKLKKTFLHTAFALTFTSGLSYIFGFLRDKTFAYKFGAGEILDTYYSAFAVTDFVLAIFVTSSIGVAFIPIFTKLNVENSKKASLYTRDILFWLSTAVILFSILIAIFIPFFVNFLVPGFSQDQQQLYISFVRIMLLSSVIFSFSNVFGGVLISTKDFFFYGIAPTFYNLGIIFGAFFLVPNIGSIGLAWGTVFGALLHALIRLVIFVQRVEVGNYFSLQISFSKEIKETIFLMMPKILQISAWQILLIWFTRLATNLSEGSVTMYNIARNFQSMPVSLLGIAISLSAFTSLNELLVQKKYLSFSEMVKKKSFLILFLTSGSALVLAGLSFWIIKFLLGGGQFGSEEVKMTALILVTYAISIPLESWMHLLARINYALGNTIIPSAIHILTISITILVSWIFVGQIGIFIIPISFTVGLVIQDLLLLLSYKILHFRVRNKISVVFFGNTF
ncbi:MAG: hypothetical protein KAT32_02770 [Candidatus Moranbacteria bacterium]|nr:hypothetical protein [Candidatus Moranbacteria bacterium]